MLCSSPPIQVTKITTDRGQVAVIRDDLLKGGTKQRAAIPFLKELKQQGIEECVYASPPFGYAQIALAHSCAAIGMRCTIFAERHNGEASRYTESIRTVANIELANNLAEAEDNALLYSRRQRSKLKIPLGFDDARYRQHFQRELSKQWRVLCGELDGPPKRLWLPCGSGTLISVFRSFLARIPIVCVDVGVLPESDRRIEHVKKMDNVLYLRAPELFIAPALQMPPYRSNPNYDAKLYQFMKTLGRDGDACWNVAG